MGLGRIDRSRCFQDGELAVGEEVAATNQDNRVAM
jgi:hypothetical protein